jgi:hypothetical protein
MELIFKKLKDWHWEFKYSRKYVPNLLDIIYDDNTSTEELDVIFKKKKSKGYICSALCRNPNTSPKVLEEISNSSVKFYPDLNWNGIELDYWIVTNPNVAVETLERIASCDSQLIRYKIRQNPKCTEDLALLIKAYEFKRNLL